MTIAVYREFTLPMSRRLRSVVLANATAPVNGAATSVVSPAEVQARQEAERQREARAEQQAVQRALASVAHAVQQLHDRQRLLVAEVQKATVELALAVASWLVRKKVEQGDYPLEAILREALERLGPQRPVTLFLHPEDLRLLESRLTGPLFPAADEVTLAADTSLARGDCQARAGEIEVLSRLEEHLAAIRGSLLRGLDHAESGARAAAADPHQP